MNVYDFDKTIYDGDSTIDFYKYCLKKKPSIVFYLPKQCYAAFLYLMGKIEKTIFKEKFYCFFKTIDCIDTYVLDFWDINQSKIKNWYMESKNESDLIISASPQFLIEEIGKRLGVKKVIASDVNPRTGEYTGENCYGEEKVRRFYEAYGEKCGIDLFFSDSKSDTPMAQIAHNAYLVHGNEIKDWE